MATSVFDQAQFKDPHAARQYLEALRWPNGPVCPHCGGADRQSKITPKTKNGARPGLYECGHCHQQYTVTVGTVFERSKIPLHKWLMAATLIAASKKGISSHQLHRMLGVTYKTAWFLSHRIREAMTKDAGMLGGGGKIVEADETYYGRTGRAPKTGSRFIRTGQKHKIFALVERDGGTRAFHVANVDGKTLKPILEAQLAKGSKLFTDSASHWRFMEHGFKHEMVNHADGEYVRGKVHTNSVESFFGLLKRGIVGTYHHVSEAHLQRYCEEFSFRHSHRTSLGVMDQQRADAVLKNIGGKRLTYRRIGESSEAIN
jgi:transposase-like protein